MRQIGDAYDVFYVFFNPLPAWGRGIFPEGLSSRDISRTEGGSSTYLLGGFYVTSTLTHVDRRKINYPSNVSYK